MSTVGVDADLVIARLRPSARAMFIPALICIGSGGAVLWLTGVFREPWMVWLIVGGGVVLFLFGSILPFLSWLARRYTVTTRKVIVQHGLFVRVRKELLHSRGYEITVRRTPMQRMTRCGDVLLKTATDDAPLRLGDVPQPLLVQSALQELIESAPHQASGLIAAHGAGTTDATKRFATELFNTDPGR